MANTFSVEERVAFEDMVQGFDDALVMSRNVGKYMIPSTTGERTRLSSGDVIWRPVPYIATSQSGLPRSDDLSSAFSDVGQLSVPSYINTDRVVAWTMDARELRDSLQNDRFGKAAAQKLASDINVALMTAATDQGTLVIKVAAAAGASSAGFTQIATAEALMNEQGVPMEDRYLALSSSDYNGIASDLASRGTLQAPKTLPAYERAYVGNVAGFETYKLDYANAIAAHASVVGGTVDGANQRHVPDTESSGKNVDNRTQTLSILVTSGNFQVGDPITIAGVYNVHPITKVSTGVLKTFRVTSLLTDAGDDGDLQISPPIIAADSTPTDIELQYKNCSDAPADTAVITLLNVAAAKINPFWHKNAIELLPGHLEVPSDSGAAVIRSTTPQGLELVLTKQYDIDLAVEKYRLDTLFGTVVTNPEQVGIILFGQT